MGKIFLILGLVGSVAAGVVLGGRIDSKDFHGTIEHKMTDHACHAVGMVLDGAGPAALPEALTKCPCPDSPVAGDGKWTVVFAGDIVQRSMPGDQLSISWKEYAPPFDKPKMTALSFTVNRGGNKETWTKTPAWPLYQSALVLAAAPLGAGMVLAFLAAVLFGKKKEKA